MKPTFTHSGWPFAVVTAAGFTALERGHDPRSANGAPRIIWDWDERTSRGARRRLVMHLAGLSLAPDDFSPGRVEVDFDEDGPVGAYYKDGWDLSAATALLACIGDLDPDERVLIALWSGQGGYVGVLQGGEEYVDVNRAEDFDGVRWSPADPAARPRWIAEHPSGVGVSLVLLDSHPPQDPGDHLDTSGLHGLSDALDDLIFDCPFEVFVRDYADGADHPPGDELTAVHGLRRRLERIAVASGELRPATHEPGIGPFDWFLLREGPRFHPIGHLVWIGPDRLVKFFSPAGDETWESMREYGLVGGFDRVVIADQNWKSSPQEERAKLFHHQLPDELHEHNQQVVHAVRAVGAQALDIRLQDLHAVWDALASWEGPVRENAGTEEFLRAYAATGTTWPTRQSKSSPSIVWIGEAEGNRPARYLEGLAGAYHAERDLLEVNADFPSFRALEAYWQSKYLHNRKALLEGTTANEINEVVAEVVREWCEQTLVEVVVGVNQLAGRPGWDEARVRAALSPEALSGAALAIHHVQQSMKRSLGQRLGSLKEAKVM